MERIEVQESETEELEEEWEEHAEELEGVRSQGPFPYEPNCLACHNTPLNLEPGVLDASARIQLPIHRDNLNLEHLHENDRECVEARNQANRDSSAMRTVRKVLRHEPMGRLLHDHMDLRTFPDEAVDLPFWVPCHHRRQNNRLEDEVHVASTHVTDCRRIHESVRVQRI